MIKKNNRRIGEGILVLYKGNLTFARCTMGDNPPLCNVHRLDLGPFKISKCKVDDFEILNVTFSKYVLNQHVIYNGKEAIIINKPRLKYNIIDFWRNKSKVNPEELQAPFIPKKFAQAIKENINSKTKIGSFIYMQDNYGISKNGIIFGVNIGKYEDPNEKNGWETYYKFYSHQYESFWGRNVSDLYPGYPSPIKYESGFAAIDIVPVHQKGDKVIWSKDKLGSYRIEEAFFEYELKISNSSDIIVVKEDEIDKPSENSNWEV